MITLGSPRDRDLILEAISDPEGYQLGMALLIGGEDYTERFFEGSWGQQDIPITLDSSLAGYLPSRLDGEKVELFVSIEGVRIPQLLSSKMEFLPGEELGTTDMLASTPGALLNGDDAIKMGEPTEYVDKSPEFIVRDVAMRLPYERSQIRVDPIQDMSLTFSGSGGRETTGFKTEDPTGDVLDQVKDSAGYLYGDTVHKGFRAQIPYPLARGQFVPEARAFSASDIPDWLRPARSSLRYYDVRVFSENPDGTIAFETRETVPYHGIGTKPHPGQTLNILLQDEVTGTDGSAGPINAQAARRRAVWEAIETGRALYEGQLSFPSFDPLVEKEDRFSVYERFENDDGLFERVWLMKILAYSHPYGTETSTTSQSTQNLHAAIRHQGAGALATVVSYSATILEEEKVYVPTLILPASALTLGSRNVLRNPAPVIRAPYEMVGDYLYIDLERVDWVRIEGDDAVVDDSGPVHLDGDYVVVEES